MNGVSIYILVTTPFFYIGNILSAKIRVIVQNTLPLKTTDSVGNWNILENHALRKEMYPGHFV